MPHRRVSDLAMNATLRRAEPVPPVGDTHLAAIFNQAAVGMSETDLQGHFMRVNDRYCELVGRSREELLGLRMQDITHPDDLATNLSLFTGAIETGSSFGIEKRYLRPDRSAVWVNNSIAPIRDADGQVQRDHCVRRRRPGPHRRARPAAGCGAEERPADRLPPAPGRGARRTPPRRGADRGQGAGEVLLGVLQRLRGRPLPDLPRPPARPSRA